MTPHNRTSKLALLVLAGVLIHAVVATQGKQSASDPWYGRLKGTFKTIKAPDQRYQVEYPAKDWAVVGVGGPVTLALTGKKGEIFVVERSVLNRALGQEDIADLFVQLETETIKERLPQAGQFQSKIIDGGDRRVVAIDFTRPAVTGGLEHARQYSIAFGKELYRLTCAAPPAAFTAYEPVCAHMAASFSPTAPK